MHVLIDRDRMWALYKHPTLQVVSDLYHLESFEDETVIISVTGPESAMLDTLTDLELKLLYKSICGQQYNGYNRKVLEQCVAMLLNELPVTKVNAQELNTQANLIPFEFDKMCRYAPGKQAPLITDDPEPLDRLQVASGFIPVPTGKPAPEVPAHPVFSKTYKELESTMFAPVEAKERAPRAPSDGPIEPPKEGSKTGRVWEICAEIYDANPAMQSDFKALRNIIKERGEREGINPSTVSVQFSKWKQTKIQN